MAFTGIAPTSGVGTPTVAKVDHDGVLSSIVSTQLPQFVQQDHPKFIQFLEAYYEWMETQGQLIHGAENIPENRDIDTSVDEFFEFFRKAYLVNISSQIITPKDLVLKNVREYYRSRGSEKSFQFFLRILLGQEATFYYPRVDVLRTSDGKWILVKAIRVSIVDGDPFDLVGRQIRGTETNSTASVDRVLIVDEAPTPLYELQLNTSSIRGNFSVEESITCDDIDLLGHITPTISTITLINPGEGYEVGQEITIGGSGLYGAAEITSVDSDGVILKTKMKNPGFGYTTATATFPMYAGVTVQATGTVNTSAIISYPGYYLNEDGQLSTTKYLQDSYYYQQFSYVVQVEEAVNTYREQIKKALHPAGLKFFGAVLSVNHTENPPGVALGLSGGAHSVVDRELAGLHTALYLGQTEISENSKIKNPDTVKEIDHILEVHSTGRKVGPNYASIEREKWTYRPNTNFIAGGEDVMTSPNNAYWTGAYANYNILAFKDIDLGDVILRPNTKTKIATEPYLKAKTFGVEDLPDYTSFLSIYDPHNQAVADVHNRISQITGVAVTSPVNAVQASDSLKPVLSRNDNKENLCINSEDISAWSTSNATVTTNIVTNPVNGATTADKIVEATDVNQQHYVESSTAKVWLGKTYRFIVYLKAAERTWAIMERGGTGFTGSKYCFVNLSTGATGTNNGALSITVETLANSWYRVIATDVATANGTGFIRVTTSSANGTISYNGNGSGIYAFGGQINDTDSDDSYVAATTFYQYRGVSGNRVAIFDGTDDHMTANALGASLSGTNKELTVFVVYYTPIVDASGRSIWAFGNAADTNPIIKIRQENGQLQTTIRDNSATIKSINSSSGIILTNTKHVLSFTTNGTTGTVYLEGASVATGDMSVGALTLDRFTVAAQGRITVNEYGFFKIGFVAVANRILSDESRQRWESYLKHRFSIS